MDTSYGSPVACYMVTSLRTMRKRLMDMERLRRHSRNRPEWEFRHNRPGFCSLCQEQVAAGGMVHCMEGLGECLSHLHDKHGGSQYVAMNNLGKFFPPWTVPRDVWERALRPDVSGIAVDVQLFHEAGCRMVHKYRVYKDPFPHPALRRGGGWSD